MKNFIREINGFYRNSIYYGDTNSVYIGRKYWHVLDKDGLNGSNLCQIENDLKNGFFFYGLFLAPKVKNCLTIDKYGIIQQHLTFKGFSDSKRLLDWSQNFKSLDGKKISFVLPGSWKKSFINGKIIPVKKRLCTGCKGEKLCMTSDNQVNESKDCEAKLNGVKRQVPNEFGHMLPYFKK